MRPIALIATVAALVVAGAPSAAFRLAADDVELAHFVVEGALYGIETQPAFSGYDIRGNLVQGNGRGLNLRSGGAHESVVRHNCFRWNERGIESENPGTLANALIDHNTTFANTRIGIGATGIPGERVNVRIGHNASYADGTAEGTGSIRISASRASTVSYNEIVGSQSGIAGGGGNVGLEISYNRVRDVAGNAIIVQSRTTEPPVAAPSTGLVISRNDTEGSGLNGIVISTTTIGALISDNRADGNGGLCFVPPPDVATTCGHGIFVGGGSSGSRVERNHTRGNTRDGIRVARTSFGNVLDGNHMWHNLVHDAHDTNRPANVWVDNHCEIDDPPGTICPAEAP